MTESKSGSNLRQVKAWQKNAARAEYLRHPDASMAEVSKATGVAVRTVARAREALVKEGLLAPGRNNSASGADAAALAVHVKAVSEEQAHISDKREGPPAPEVVAPPAPTSHAPAGKGTIDGEAMRQMTEMLDGLADEDDEKTRDRMLRQMKRFAFDPALHPDTRMSASQLWAKLLDMKRAKDLGPGIPLTFEAAVGRAVEFLRACGIKVAVPAFYKAFDLGDPDAETTQAMVEGQPAPAATEPAGPGDHDRQVGDEA